MKSVTARSYVPFIILTTGRSGSNMLTSQLNAHPEIVCFAEIFNYAADGILYNVDGYDGRSREDIGLRDRDRIGFLQARIFGHHHERTRGVGFKLPYEHAWLVPDVQEWLQAQPDLRIIHLRRRNLLRVAASLRMAETTGIWKQLKSDPSGGRLFTLRSALRAIRHPGRAINALSSRMRPPPAQPSNGRAITLTAKECRFFFNWVEENATQYEQSFREKPLLAVYYEDLVAENTKHLKEIQTFLGAQSQSLPIATRQQNPEPLRELISNYDELKTTFADTKYAEFFD